MFEYLWLPCMVTVAAIALSAAILFKEFLKKRASQTAVEGSAYNDSATEDGTVESVDRTCTSPPVNEAATSSDYEVFLSFNGKDTRKGFTSFLYTTLKDAGIRVYKDDEELPKGENFGPELLQAIGQSKISMPIFSKSYASSKWCLEELVEMVKCQKTGRQKIMPIFYDVAPSEVRYQTEGYKKAFLTHESKNRYDKDIMRQWKAALAAVGELDGWDLQSMPNRGEGEIAKIITHKVFNELKKAYLVLSDNLVNVDNHVHEIVEEIGAQTSESRIIGIYGMGGVGKTTIAKIIYNKLSNNFEDCCFLSNIRETSESKGIEFLQHQLITDILKKEWTDIRNIDDGIKTIRGRMSNKKVLLLLDDVAKKDHMDALVGKRDWFGKGSKIIITTRWKDVLKVPEVDWMYELKGMDSNQSLQLFSKHAFRRDSPLDEYMDQSYKAIRIASNLPLALEVIGSLLSSKNKEMWDDTLKMLESVPPNEVQSKLKISFDALEERQKQIFLDIACLFIGYDKDIVVHFWDVELFPKVALEVLENMSLIKIEESNTVWMHDQLRDLGREIVRQESKMKIEKQSRVWNPKEAMDFLRRHEGKTKVEALCLKIDRKGWRYCFTYKDFKRLSNLRFLEVNGSIENFCVEKRLLWHESPSDVLPTNDFQENSNLLPQLRWLSWRDIPPAFDITNFSMVVILNLSQSKIIDDWKGWNHIKEMKNLKILDLSHSKGFQRTPIFSTNSNLERLTLRGCVTLIEIDRSICQLERLVLLDISSCKNLQRLPDELGRGLANLKYLYLNGCTSLEKLPDSIGNLKSLIKLNISNTSIKELPNSIRTLKELKVVKMQYSSLSKIPNVLWSMGNLEDIVASRKFYRYGDRHFRHFHVNIGNGIYGSQSLKILILTSANIYALPRLPESLVKLHLSKLHMDMFPNLSNLTNVKNMDLHFGLPHQYRICNGLGEHLMPRWIGNLSKLEFLALRSPYVTTSPTDLTLPPRLNSLTLCCPNLRRLPRLPSSLSSLDLDKCKSLCSMGDLSNLKKLSSLHIDSAAIAEIPGLGFLEKLQELRLRCLGKVEILPDLSNLNKLRELRVRSCDKLVEIQGQLPQFLEHFAVGGCGSLQKLPDLSSLMGKRVFAIDNCKKLNVEAILVVARQNPRRFMFKGLEQLQILPDLSNSNELKHLEVEGCDNLVEIQGELPQSLEVLKIHFCKSLWKLHNLSSSTGLREVHIGRCHDLVEIQSELPQSLEKLVISYCMSLRKLPNMSSLIGLREVSIDCCHNLVEISEELPQSLREFRICSCHDLVEIPEELPQSLEILAISYCKSLRKLPNMSSLIGLREVSIHYCDNLVEIPEELPQSLRKFGIGDCHDLVEIPEELPQSLEVLKIYPCKSLRELPNLSSLTRLQEVSINQSLQKLPYLSSLIRLREVRIQNCDNLVEISSELPQSLEVLKIVSCKSLQKLHDLSSLMRLQDVFIRDCNDLIEIQGELPQSLEKLVIFRCVSLHKLPYLSSLIRLREVAIENCDNLVEIPGELPQPVETLELFHCNSLQKLPYLSSSMRLQTVYIAQCSNLVEILGELPQSCKKLKIICCKSLQKLLYLSSSMRLQEVYICNCDNLVEIQGELPQFLKVLSIISCKSLQKLPNLSSSTELREVHIGNCNDLVKIQDELPQSLKKLEIFSCVSLQKLSYLSSLMGLQEVCIKHCDNLVEILGELPQSLKVLKIDSSCKSLHKLPHLSSLTRLREVSIGHCNDLVEIQGELPQSLEKLMIFYCASLQKLPYLSSLIGLQEVCIQNCDNLVEIPGELPQSLEKLKIFNCVSLQKLPYLSKLIGLQEVCVQNCDNLVEILGELSQFLKVLKIDSSCKSLQKLPYLSRLTGLQEVFIGHCNDLVEIQGGLPQSLKKLVIFYCGSLRKLPYLSSLIELQMVSIENCDNLVEISGELPQSLEELKINLCKSLQKLPYLSSLARLRKVYIQDCDNLVEIPDQLPQSLEVLNICECQSLQELPNLSSLKGLQWVKIKRCKKLNVQAISSLCLEKSVTFVGEDDESKSKSEEDE